MIGKFKILIVSAVSLLFLSCSNQPRISFDKELWLESDSLRYQMLDNLVESDILIGKKPDEVISLLGVPEYRWDSLGKWQYNAGAAAVGLGVSFYSLVIWFKNGVVDSTVIAERHD